MPKGTSMERQENNELSGLDPAELLKQGAGEDTFTENHPGGFTPPTLEELSEIFPRFEILELIGRGGMGAVYKVRQPELDRIVAMKILPPAIGLSPAFASRFTREAKALAKLNHPGIVTIHESGQEGGLYYILMEYVDGVNLRQLLNNGRISPREAMAIVPQICDALQFAHDQGIVHRDIKPENLLLDRLGRVKVADFGIAKLIGNEDPAATAAHTMDATLTDGSKAMGTPQYMAPEQTDSPMEVDHRADIFALGVVFYQMLTGELPEKDLQAPSSKVRIDVRLDEVVLRALEKDPDLRYLSATEMRTGIEMVGDGLEGTGEEISASTWSKGYRSEKTIFGLPLVHIAGFEPKDGKQETAKGILAIGGKAQGVLAFGGVASGVFAFGGVAIGLFSFGGVAVGAISFGGLSIALFLALGGLAFGFAAMGGNAFGYLGYGAKAHAAHALSPQHIDPVAKDFFFPWAPDLLANLGVILFILMALVFLVSFGVPLWIMQRRAVTGKSFPGNQPVRSHRSVEKRKSTNFKILAVLGVLLLFVIAVPIVIALLFFSVRMTSVTTSGGSTRMVEISQDIITASSSQTGIFELPRFFPEDEISIVDLLGRRMTPLGDKLLEEAELPDFGIAYHTATDTDGTTGQEIETRHFLSSRAENFSISASPTGPLKRIPDPSMDWEVVQKDPYGTASISMTGNLGRWYAFRIVSTKGRTAYGSFRLSPSESPAFQWTYLGGRAEEDLESREREVVRSKIAAISKRLGDQHPEVLELEENLKKLDGAALASYAPKSEIQLSRDGSSQLDGDEIPEEEIFRKIGRANEAEPNLRILLRADYDLPMAEVTRWMEKLSSMGISKIELASHRSKEKRTVLRDETGIPGAMINQPRDPVTTYIELSLKALEAAALHPHHSDVRLEAEKELSDFILLHPEFPNKESLELAEKQFNDVRREYAEKIRKTSKPVKIDTAELENLKIRLMAFQDLTEKSRKVLTSSKEIVLAKDLPASNRIAIRMVDAAGVEAQMMNFTAVDENGEEYQQEVSVSPNAVIWDGHISEALISGEAEKYQIHITLDQIGTRRMIGATQPVEKQLRLAIVIDGKIHSTPIVQGGPLGSRFVISGLEENEAFNLLRGLPTWEKQIKSDEALAWLVEIDAGNYGKSHELASKILREAVTPKNWEQMLEQVRTPLGMGSPPRKPVKIEDLKSLPGMPDGDYRIVKFETSFPKKPSAIEIVSLTKESDGVWRVSGYFIK